MSAQPAPEVIRSVFGVLKRLELQTSRLLEVMERERQAMVRRDAPLIEEAVADKIRMLDELSAAEQDLQQLMGAVVVTASAADNVPLRLSSVAAMLDEPEASRLDRLRHRVYGKLEEARRGLEANRLLAGQCRDLALEGRRRLAALMNPPATYGRDGLACCDLSAGPRLSGSI